MIQEGSVVEPVKVKVGSRPGRLHSGRVGDVDLYAYFIPVLKSLQMLLTHCEIYEAVRASNVNSNGSESHGSGGQVWDIWLGMSVDDVEFSNPIGQAKGTHKQTIGSYHLLNLPPEWRASDKAKNVLFVCNANIFNKIEGADEPLLRDLKQSIEASENGIPLVRRSYSALSLSR